ISSSIRPSAGAIPTNSGLLRGNAWLLCAAQLLRPANELLRTSAGIPTEFLPAASVLCSVHDPLLRAAAWLLSITRALLWPSWEAGILPVGRSRISPLVRHNAANRSARHAGVEGPRMLPPCCCAIGS